MRAFSSCPGQASIREGLNPIPVIGVVKYINVHEILTQQILTRNLLLRTPISSQLIHHNTFI